MTRKFFVNVRFVKGARCAMKKAGTALLVLAALGCATAASARTLDDRTSDSEYTSAIARRKLLGSQSDGTPVLDWILARQSGEETATPVLDWILARQSGEETATPALDYFLDFATDNTLFGPTTFVERVVNRATTFFFSELLRFNLTATVERQSDESARAAHAPTSWNSTFAQNLYSYVDDDGQFGYNPLNVSKFVESDVCGSDFLRANLDDTAMDDAYWQAADFSGTEIPRGRYEGCILGTGTYEAIARAYGVRRTFNFDSWRGKVFDQIDPASVRNLIQLNYGTLLNSVFPRLAEPIELYPGRAEISSSNFQPGTNAVVVDYSSFNHDFTYFRDELRPIYPGVFLGKMYAMPGMSMFGGALQVPIGAAPVYTVSFILVGEPQTTMPLQVV